MVRKRKNAPSTTAGSDIDEEKKGKHPANSRATNESRRELRERKKVKFSQPVAPASPPPAKGHKQRGHMGHQHTRKRTKLEFALLGLGLSQLGISEEEQAGFVRVAQQGNIDALRAAAGEGIFDELAAEIGEEEDSEMREDGEDEFESEEAKAEFEAWLRETGQGDLCSSPPSKKDGGDDEDGDDVGGGDAVAGVTSGVQGLTLSATSAV